MAPSNATSTAPCNGTLVPRPISQSGSSPSPPIGSKNPYSYRYLGKTQPFGEGPFAAMVFKPWRAVCQLKSRIFSSPLSSHPFGAPYSNAEPLSMSLSEWWQPPQGTVSWACDKNQTTKKKMVPLIKSQFVSSGSCNLRKISLFLGLYRYPVNEKKLEHFCCWLLGRFNDG